MTVKLRSRVTRPLGIVVVATSVALGGCADSSQILESADVFNLFTPAEQRLPGERRAALPQTDRLEVDPQAAATPVRLPEPSLNSEWAQPGGTPSNAPGHLALSSGGGWTASVARLDRQERLTSPPIVYQGVVYVMDNQASVTAYSMSGGGRAWSANLRPEGERGRAFGGGVAADGGVLIAATPFGKVHGLDPSSGGEIWVADIGAPARGAPTVVNGRAFVVSADNQLHAIQSSDGSVLWSYTGIGGSTGVLGNASPAVSGDNVIVPYSSGEIVAYAAGSGDTRWFDALTGASRFTTVSGLNDVIARPVVYEGVVYAVSVSGRMIAVSAGSGERLWAANVASSHTPAVAGNSIFVATLGGEVVSLNRADGKIRWRTDLAEGQRVGVAGPLLAGGRLWVGTSDGRLVTLDPSTGAVGSTQNMGNPVFIGPIAANGRVLVLDNGGRLTAVN